jgi:hypothetical protein
LSQYSAEVAHEPVAAHASVHRSCEYVDAVAFTLTGERVPSVSAVAGNTRLGPTRPISPKLEMIPLHTVIKAAATASVATLLSAGALGGTASAMEARDATETFGRLTALNNSGAEDSAEATVNGRRVVVDIDARKLVKGVPHAQHIHFGAQARHECPQAFDDKNATTS